MIKIEEKERKPAEVPEADDVEAIRQEVVLVNEIGWLRRKNWILELLQEDGKKLMLGLIPDQTERERAVGRCQAYTQVMDRDQQIQEAWKEVQLEDAEKRKDEELEGGDYGVTYEAAQ